MSEKIALVFDTNFIISYKNELSEVHKKLSITYDIYISEISIKERLSQKYLDLSARFDKIHKFKKENDNYINLELKYPFETCFEAENEYSSNGYKKLFGDKIIIFNQNLETFKKIMDRIFKKIPPFNKADNASDKGFKDTMLWLSILDYFKSNGNKNIIFATDDKAFKNNEEALCREFNEFTSKNIEIKENSFFETTIKQEEEIVEPLPSKVRPNIDLLRENVQMNVSALCFGIFDCDVWGNPEKSRLFKLQKKVTASDMKILFESLKDIINENLFEISLPANFSFKNLSIENEFDISINALQNAQYLYRDIYENYIDYLPQFFNTAANIFNQNYEEDNPFSDDIPF